MCVESQSLHACVPFDGQSPPDTAVPLAQLHCAETVLHTQTSSSTRRAIRLLSTATAGLGIIRGLMWCAAWLQGHTHEDRGAQQWGKAQVRQLGTILPAACQQRYRTTACHMRVSVQDMARHAAGPQGALSTRSLSLTQFSLQNGFFYRSVRSIQRVARDFPTNTAIGRSLVLQRDPLSIILGTRGLESLH